jgi:hypothetical protein
VVRAITAIFDEVDHIQLFERIIADEKVYDKIARLLQPEEKNKNAA